MSGTASNATIDERTLHEIYLPAFKAAVEEGGVWNVMSAYNKVNGVHCGENDYLAGHGAEEGIRVQGICGVGLGQHLLDGADGECGDGPGDAGRAADGEVDGESADIGERATAMDGWWLTKVLAEVKAGTHQRSHDR